MGRATLTAPPPPRILHARVEAVMPRAVHLCVQFEDGATYLMSMVDAQRYERLYGHVPRTPAALPTGSAWSAGPPGPLLPAILQPTYHTSPPHGP